jgi:glycosyltransferase involved in cell wall biosynthesis
MKILAIFPGLNPKYDDLAHAIQELVTLGHQVMVLAARTSELKSKEVGELLEEVEGVSYYRPFFTAREMVENGLNLSAEIVATVKAFAPEAIFASSFRGLKVARGLALSGVKAPTLMRVEHLDPIQAIYGRRYYLGIPWLGRMLGRAKWRAHARHMQGVVTTNAADLYQAQAYSYLGDRVFFAPHCNQLPRLRDEGVSRDRGLMIYVGSLIRDKLCERWSVSVEQIFDKTPVERFQIIGDGPFRHVVESLKARFGNRIEHVVSLPRSEALERLLTACFAYTEAIYGWGFIGDCWATGTPLLAPNSTYGLVRNYDALMPMSVEQMLKDINRLYVDDKLYQALSANGLRRYQSNHTSSIVAAHYDSALRSIVANP